MATSPPGWLRYSIPILAAGLAALASASLYPASSATPSVLFIAAVALSAWYGGLGPGLVATVLGTLAFDYLFVDSPFSLALQSPLAFASLAGFLGVALLITYLTATLRQDIARREGAEAELRRLASALEERASSAEARYQELSLVDEISRSVLGTADLPVLADQFLAGAIGVGQYDIGLLRLAREDGSFEVAAYRGYNDSVNLPPLLPNPQSWLVVSSLVPLIVENVEEDPEFPRLQQEAVKSCVVVPIVAGEDALGLLMVGTRSPHAFDQGEVKLLETIANQAGLALQKARLFAETTEAHTELQGSELGRSRLVAILEATTDLVLTFDATTGETYLNRAGRRMFGIGDDEPIEIGRIASRQPRWVDELIRTQALPAVQRDGIWTGEAAYLDPEGCEVPVDTVLMAHRGPDGAIAFYSAVCRDVTSRKEAADALATSLLLLETTLESTADGILVVDGNGRIVRFNQTFLDMWRIPPSIVASGSDDEALSFVRDQLLDPDAFDQKVRDLYAHPEAESFDTIEFKDGRVFERHSRAKRIEGHPSVRVWSFHDVSDRREIERRLLRAQRLETAGRISVQVAHDFNNLLTPLMGFPELMKEQLPEGHRAIPYCDMMMQAAEQMAQINEDLLALGRRGHFEQVPVDLNQLVTQARIQLGTVPETLATDLQIASDLPPVSGAPAQLVRLITNLVANAREAMQDVGTLTLHTAHVYVDEPTGQMTQVPVGEYVRLEVGDTGSGIPRAVRDHIFDAFFTTKPAGSRRGTGLGLSVVQAVVDDHEGHLDFVSEAGQGTTFFVYLPIARDAPREQPVEQLVGGTESILVVDDDPFQRAVAQELLESAGYRLSVVASGEEAIAAVAAAPVDLLILDMVMPPGIDGAETYRRVLEHCPGQRAILLSGFAESKRVAVAQRLGAGAFVRKPVSRQRLAAAVRVELDRATVTVARIHSPPGIITADSNAPDSTRHGGTA